MKETKSVALSPEGRGALSDVMAAFEAYRCANDQRLAEVPPHRFWRLSLREWRALTAPSGPAPLSRAEFEALFREHPDRPA